MRKSKKNLIQPIVWAIDPYEGSSAHRAPLAKFLQAMGHSLAQEILPFSVVSTSGRQWLTSAERVKDMDLKAFGTHAVEQNLKNLHMRNVARPTIEVHESASRRELVDNVLRFSRASKAGFIAVNTRRLLSPFPFKVGGFAEALISKSRVPIIAVSPKSKVPKHIKTILFPTDLSPRSHRAYRKTLELAARLKARVHILHLEIPIAAPYAFIDVPIVIDQDLVAKAEREQLRHDKQVAERWVAEAKKAGIRSSYQVVHGPISIAKAILQGAKRQKADLISLASYRHPKAPAVIGGTVRDVLSSARTPVLEIRAA
ncbi:MAG: universal stress protein [Bdellovibrionota bacterium]